jgi:Resolvase, N terminal domain
MRGKFISYLRVSTDKQGERGYGLDAQRKAVADYLNGGSWELLGEYVEIESAAIGPSWPRRWPLARNTAPGSLSPSSTGSAETSRSLLL